MTAASRPIHAGLVAAVLAVALGVVGPPGGLDPVAARPARPARLVLAISVDGLRPAALERLGPSGTPAYHRMLREGAGTLNARSAVERTTTLPNHTGMLTGRPVDRSRGGHGVADNKDLGGTVHTAAGEHVSSVFDVVAASGGRTALFTAKDKFALFHRSWRRSIGRFHVNTDNAVLVRSVRKELVERPRRLTFLHLSLPDRAGHARGFGSPAYLTAVRRTDRLLGTLLATVRRDAWLRDHLLVVLTADHGGAGHGHTDRTALTSYRVPFLTWGAGVARGRDLYALNPELTRPGTRRPGYTGRQPVRNGDLANLVLDALGLPSIAGSRLNARRTLDLR